MSFAEADSASVPAVKNCVNVVTPDLKVLA